MDDEGPEVGSRKGKTEGRWTIASLGRWKKNQISDIRGQSSDYKSRKAEVRGRNRWARDDRFAREMDERDQRSEKDRWTKGKDRSLRTEVGGRRSEGQNRWMRDDRCLIFRDDQDRDQFLGRLGDRYGYQGIAYAWDRR